MTQNLRTMIATTAAVLLIGAAAAQAQTTAETPEIKGFWLTTPFPELTLSKGDTGQIPLTLRNAGLPPQRAVFEVSGLPDSWQWHLKGGGHEVQAAIVGSDQSERVSLELVPPKEADSAAHTFKVTARYDDGTAVLPMAVSLTDVETGGLTLEPELPALRGSPNSTFSYKVKITNSGSEDALFNLTADVPTGFQTTFKRGYGSEEITGVPIEAGKSETVTVEVKPARTTGAGSYQVGLTAQGGDLSNSTVLSLEVTGTPELVIVGPQERLSGDAVAGQERQFEFTLANTGSAAADDLKLSATPPNGWKVSFSPEQVASVPASGTQKVTVGITPPEQAIAGDYVVALRADGTGVNQRAQFRVTVRTSTVWGVAGIGVIAAAALVLGFAVMRYGRR